MSEVVKHDFMGHDTSKLLKNIQKNCSKKDCMLKYFTVLHKNKILVKYQLFRLLDFRLAV